MKKLFCALVATLFLLSPLCLSVSADDTDAEQMAIPDWIITELAADTSGRAGNTNGYTEDAGKDTFEFIELYNSSGRELNLYDYALTYNGSDRDTDKFETQIHESTPIKAGDFWDGTTIMAGSGIFSDLSNKPVNPETCMIAPGETVVLWVLYYESYLAEYNDGKGMSMADFRAHWNIPEDVKVIAVDGNSSDANGGHKKNFNVKNKDVGTYGIAKQSPELEANTNTDTSTYIEGLYTESEHLIFWVSIDFTDSLLDGSMANVTYNYTWDFAGYAATDQAYTYHNGGDYVYDARRGFLLTMYDEPTPGTLNPLQKMSLGVELAEGESFPVDSFVMYYPLQDANIRGIKVNGEFYKNDSTFTAPAAGVYTFDYFFEGDEEDKYTVSFEINGYPFEQPADVNVTVGSCMEAPTVELPDDGSRFDGWYTSSDCNPDSKFDFSTPITENMTLYAVLIPAETVTEAPTEVPTETPTEAPTEAPAEAPKGGCGSVMGLSLLPCLSCVLFFRKKREN